ncbi:hypothetical protein DYE49_11290 [Treponema rectale]|uniref:Uncharacterized protein n=1 Tax=Treponema rectale TaxID=744512 RepID=A0A840SED9_9SPIR|nr:hypothetical protein [Treponema rectale]MBB5219100.1 hypothetical protein [Treponema rectale]QOS40998.1 hypothetical protein DYE49_11290 [Treponema rectale]
MQAFKLIKKVTALTVLANSVYGAFCENKQQSPSISTPTVPEIKIDVSQMPSLSAPTIGEGFYTPNTVSSKIYEAPKTQKTVPAKISSNTSSGEQQLKKALSKVSASDLSLMSELGMLDSIYDGSITSESDSSFVLEQILTKLEQIKEQNADILSKTESEKNYSTPAKEYLTGSEQEETSAEKKTVIKPKILRFSINSYDILKTCRKIYISNLQEDGTFLITGDRRYISDGKTRTETFYLYFNLEKDSGTSTYKVTVSVSQDYLNEYSFLYQMSQKKNLSAIRTGNLLTIHTVDSNWQLDFLADLGESE